jgi:hypothetical protein
VKAPCAAVLQRLMALKTACCSSAPTAEGNEEDAGDGADATGAAAVGRGADRPLTPKSSRISKTRVSIERSAVRSRLTRVSIERSAVRSRLTRVSIERGAVRSQLSLLSRSGSQGCSLVARPHLAPRPQERAAR